MVRAIFFLGFLIGAGVASLFSDGERGGAPGAPTSAVAPATPDEGGLKGTLRAALQEAKAAARSAADEKEREMMRQFEQTIRRR